MEGLAPILKCLIEVQSSIQNGEPIRAGLSKFLQGASARDETAIEMRRFLFSWEQGQDWRSTVRNMKTPQRRALAELLASGLRGQPILPLLEELKIEMERACEIEIKGHLESLPMRMLVPLLLFQFPAFLLLLFGPLLSRLVAELSR
jgi:hypothetical protein